VKAYPLESIKKIETFFTIYKQTTTNEMITDFTTEQLIAELKKRGCVLQVIKPKTYELQDDCWTIVKEYAGIYDWTTQWFKMDKIGIDRLHTYYRTSFHLRFTNIHCNIPKLRQRILKNILQRFKNQRSNDGFTVDDRPADKNQKKRYVLVKRASSR